jgi:hypothetical protein
MPLAKKYRDVSVHDIYKTQTDANQRLKKLFNVKNVNARRRADHCLGFKYSFIANPEEFSNKLQTIVQKPLIRIFSESLNKETLERNNVDGSVFTFFHLVTLM